MMYRLEKTQGNVTEVLRQMAELEKEIFQGTSYSYENLLAMLILEQYRIFYMEEKEQVQAYLLVLDAIDCFEILKIATRKEDRRKGLAAKLLRKIATKPVFLEVREHNETARRFYQKQGFQEIGIRKEYYPDTKENAIRMMMEVSYEL